MAEIYFSLDIDNGWPPVAIECMDCIPVDGGFQIRVPPFFLKNLSVGDVIEVTRDEHANVVAWKHKIRSRRSTIWIMLFGSRSIESALDCLKSMQCNIERFVEYKLFSIDIPAECSLDEVDACLAGIEAEDVAIVYPSLRHEAD